MIRVFVGYDSREEIGYHAACSSMLHNTSSPLAITPLKLSQLEGIFCRPIASQSTEFTYSRFLVPYLSGFSGFSIFIDCDVIVLGDLAELIASVDPLKAVSVVKHSYQPKDTIKFNGEKQVAYPKKNWSSVMVFNNDKCRGLTPGLVSSASGSYLHRFEWLDEDQVGEIGAEWNFLVGEYEADEALPKLIHYTLGGPYFKNYSDCDYFEIFNKYRDMVNSAIEKKICE